MTLLHDSSRGRLPRGLASILVVAVSLASFGCAEEEQTVEELLPSVSVYVLEARTLSEQIKASGDLEAQFHTEIAAEVEGRVTELTIDEGGSVEEGVVVIEIDPERRQLDLEAAKARLAQKRAELANQQRKTRRIRELRSQSVSSIQQLEEAETMLALARSAVSAEVAAVGVAERRVRDSSVAAPFAGLVARRSVELGEFVQPGKSLFELVALDPLEAIFSLTELDTERVRLGQTVEISVGAFPDRKFQGVVTFVAPTVDPDTRTLRIKAEVDNAEGHLRPGLFARMNLGVAERTNVLMVPAEALIQRVGGASIYRVVPTEENEGRVERVSVEVGATDGDFVEVRGDVRPGDQVVRRGHGGLASGMSVVVRGATASRPQVAAGEEPRGNDS
ncbi:MAG: efflux RND transporter periplasmic adaptor subunit [bacterium]|nr:efflux RND transporter periplasmic adaptor subunit [bacterium]